MQPVESFTYDSLPRRVLFGIDCVAHLADEIRRLGSGRRVVLIGDASVSSHAERVGNLLGDYLTGHWNDVRQHVPTDLVDEALCYVQERGANTLVVVGGGSATGLAKALTLQMALDILCIPTTYAGSEMTPIWGLSEGKRKHTGSDLRVLPKTVLYDPRLTLELPPSVTGPSGFNALAHCVEATYALATNPIIQMQAIEGIRVLTKGLPSAVSDPRDLGSRSWCLLGAYLAGAVLAVAGVALHHKVCHILGGDYGLDHGKMNAVLLPFVLRFNAPAISDTANRIAAALEVDDPAQGLLELARRLDCPRSLKELGLPEDAIGPATKRVVAEPISNPRPLDEAAVHAMLAAAYEGTLPGRL